MSRVQTDRHYVSTTEASHHKCQIGENIANLVSRKSQIDNYYSPNMESTIDTNITYTQYTTTNRT